MTENLFRAKDHCRHKWVYGFYYKMDKYLHKIKPIDKSGNAMLCDCSVDEGTLGAYTGLTDKNGTKIFEWDIVTIDKLLGVYLVMWNQEQCRFSLYQNGVEQAGFNKETMKNYEVIGNIYDNPKLLES